jgi:hypothetical protein
MTGLTGKTTELRGSLTLETIYRKTIYRKVAPQQSREAILAPEELLVAAHLRDGVGTPGPEPGAYRSSGL